MPPLCIPREARKKPPLVYGGRRGRGSQTPFLLHPTCLARRVEEEGAGMEVPEGTQARDLLAGWASAQPRNRQIRQAPHRQRIDADRRRPPELQPKLRALVPRLDPEIVQHLQVV